MSTLCLNIQILFYDTNSYQAVVFAACIGNIQFDQGPVGEDGKPTDLVIRGSYLLSLVRRGAKKQDEEEKGVRLESFHGREWSRSTVPEVAVRQE
jgi:hypothetical protein